MKLVKFGLVVAVVAALAGCSPSPADIAHDAAVNRDALTMPQIIGTLPGGQVVSRVQLQYHVASNTVRTHFVYIVDGARTQTVNWTQQEGKTQVPYTQTTIQLPVQE